jgi:hypothetical protein
MIFTRLRIDFLPWKSLDVDDLDTETFGSTSLAGLKLSKMMETRSRGFERALIPGHKPR